MGASRAGTAPCPAVASRQVTTECWDRPREGLGTVPESLGFSRRPTHGQAACVKGHGDRPGGGQGGKFPASGGSGSNSVVRQIPWCDRIPTDAQRVFTGATPSRPSRCSSRPWRRRSARAWRAAYRNCCRAVDPVLAVFRRLCAEWEVDEGGSQIISTHETAFKTADVRHVRVRRYYFQDPFFEARGTSKRRPSNCCPTKRSAWCAIANW
jgi:hypothetical protein